jgi:phosphohistidine phosphatase
MPKRRLMLLRHGKSDWPGGVDDLERPLAKRGRKASSLMGGYLARHSLIPDLVLVSPARRTRQTWEMARPAFARDIARRDEPRIYEASAPAILGVIAETAPEIRVLLVVGHNPGLQDLARALIGAGRNQDLARLARKYPTAGLAIIDFDVTEWRDASAGTGQLERFETPASVGDPDGDD